MKCPTHHLELVSDDQHDPDFGSFVCPKRFKDIKTRRYAKNGCTYYYETPEFKQERITDAEDLRQNWKEDDYVYEKVYYIDFDEVIRTILIHKLDKVNELLSWSEIADRLILAGIDNLTPDACRMRYNRFMEELANGGKMKKKIETI